MGQKLFVTDLDGTLLNDKKTISQHDLATLRELKNKNVIVVVATGRSIYLFNQALSVMGAGACFQDFPIDYVIFSTGAGIMEFSSDKLICSKSIDCPGIQKITAYFNNQHIDYMIHKAIPDTHTFVYKSFNNHNPDFDTRLTLYKQFAQPFSGSLENFGSATQLVGIVPKNKIPDRFDDIRQSLPDFSVIHATSPLDHKSLWIEVFHKDVSKSRAVAWLSNQLKIKRKDVIAVGNDYNDEDLLSWAGQAYVVDNALAFLKQKFNCVSSNNLSGITHAVDISGILNQLHCS